MRESLWRVPCEVAPRERRAISGRLAYGAPRDRAAVGVHEHAPAGVDDDDPAAQAPALLAGEGGQRASGR